MDYLQSADKSVSLQVQERNATNKTERPTGPQAVTRSALPATKAGGEAPQLDRVTLSPQAEFLAKASLEAAPSGVQRLATLAQAIKQDALPIYPKAIAEAILRDEGLGQIGQSDPKINDAASL